MLPVAAHCRRRKGNGNRDLVVPSLGQLLRGAGWRAVLPRTNPLTLERFILREAPVSVPA